MKPEELQEYSQPRKNKLKRQKNLLLDIPERPRLLTGNDFAELEKNLYYEEYSTKDKKYPDITYHGRPRCLKGDFAKMEQDHLDYLERTHYGSQIDMFRSYKKKNSYYSSNRVGFFETFFRYVRNKFFRNNINDFH